MYVPPKTFQIKTACAKQTYIANNMILMPALLKLLVTPSIYRC